VDLSDRPDAAYQRLRRPARRHDISFDEALPAVCGGGLTNRVMHDNFPGTIGRTPIVRQSLRFAPG